MEHAQQFVVIEGVSHGARATVTGWLRTFYWNNIYLLHRLLSDSWIGSFRQCGIPPGKHITAFKTYFSILFIYSFLTNFLSIKLNISHDAAFKCSVARKRKKKKQITFFLLRFSIQQIYPLALDSKSWNDQYSHSGHVRSRTTRCRHQHWIRILIMIIIPSSLWLNGHSMCRCVHAINGIYAQGPPPCNGVYIRAIACWSANRPAHIDCLMLYVICWRKHKQNCSE